MYRNKNKENATKKIAAAILIFLLFPNVASGQTSHDDDMLLLLSSIKIKPRFDARFVSESVPSQMTYDSPSTVKITMKNTGREAWPANTTSLIQDINDINWRPSNTALSAPVQPGDTYTFNFTVTPKSCTIWGLDCYQANFIWQINISNTPIGQRTPPVGIKLNNAGTVALPTKDSLGYRGYLLTLPSEGPPPADLPPQRAYSPAYAY